MGRSEWQQALRDEGVVTVPARRGGSRGLAALKWLGWFFVVAALTFGGAFYLPLRSAHQGLSEEYRALANKYAARGTELETRSAELASTRDERDALEEQQAQAKTAAEAEQTRVDRLADPLTKQLAGLVEAKVLEVTRGERFVTISFAETAVRDPKTLTLTPTGRAAVCKAAGAVKSLGSSVEVVIPLGEGDWEAAGVRGASIGQRLQVGCGIEASQLSVRSTGSELSGAFELRFAPRTAGSGR